MTPTEAEHIIEQFHQAIRDLRPDAIVQSSKTLPYTSARIKYAHFVYGEYLINNVTITEAKLQEVIESYGIIESLFNEDPEPINTKYREYLEGLRNGIITHFRMPNPFGESEPVGEFHNFLGECWFLRYHTGLFTGNALGAYIYEAIRDKAIKAQDIQSLIRLANTSLTRAVTFPCKRSNAESVFVTQQPTSTPTTKPTR